MSSIEALHDLLFGYANAGSTDGRNEIDAEVWRRHGVTGAVFVLDMSGFSHTSQTRGIVYYLALVRRMQIIVGPVIERYGGRVVKFEADNCFAHFPSVDQAIQATIGIRIAIDAANSTTPEDLDIEVACGIDYGEFLLLEDRDFFGLPVNHASKLGEDLAGAGEVLVTREAMATLENPERYAYEETCFTISNITLEACRLVP